MWIGRRPIVSCPYRAFLALDDDAPGATPVQQKLHGSTPGWYVPAFQAGRQNRGDLPLGLPTSFHHFYRMRSFKHRLQSSPTTPENQPTWFSVAFSVLVSAQARKRKKEVVYGPIGTHAFMSPDAQHFNVVGSMSQNANSVR